MNRILIEPQTTNLWRIVNRECTTTGFSKIRFKVLIADQTSLEDAKKLSPARAVKMAKVKTLCIPVR